MEKVKNIIGKEYYIDNKIKFEGGFKNGLKWNRRGYDNHKKFVYGLKNGKGNIKEYNILNGELEFEGEYLNGQKNGIGKEYNDANKIKFEGKY